MTTGTVVRFNEARGFGFIEPDDGGDDLFVHASGLQCEERSTEEFSRELTDLMLDTSIGLTATQIVEIRSRLVASAAAHGWIED